MIIVKVRILVWVFLVLQLFHENASLASSPVSSDQACLNIYSGRSSGKKIDFDFLVQKFETTPHSIGRLRDDYKLAIDDIHEILIARDELQSLMGVTEDADWSKLPLSQKTSLQMLAKIWTRFNLTSSEDIIEIVEDIIDRIPVLHRSPKRVAIKLNQFTKLSEKLKDHPLSIVLETFGEKNVTHMDFNVGSVEEEYDNFDESE
jgi:hypothetical protein